MHGLGMDLLYTLAAVCYIAVLFSSSSFLVDFLGMGFARPRLVVSLHISTGAYFIRKLQVWYENLSVKSGLKGQDLDLDDGLALCIHKYKYNIN